jgi:hypothetical protein
LETLSSQLNEGYHRVAANLSTNPDVRIEQVKGKDRLSLTGLDKLEESASLIALRDKVDALLPRIDLTDAMLEIHGYTGFADEFTHISQNNARVERQCLSNYVELVEPAARRCPPTFKILDPRKSFGALAPAASFRGSLCFASLSAKKYGTP